MKAPKALHIACRFHHDHAVEVISLLVEAYPRSTLQEDVLHQLPIRIAKAHCSNNANNNVDNEELYRILQPGVSMEGIQPMKPTLQLTTMMTVRERIEQANSNNNNKHSNSFVVVEGNTMLFSDIVDQRWMEVAQRCRDCPRDASTWYMEKKTNHPPHVKILPLHRALEEEEDVPVAAITALKRKDHSERLPLHTALWRNSCNTMVIQYLINKNTAALLSKDLHGSRPLHIAAQFGSNADVIKMILKENIAADSCCLTREDDLGRTPLKVCQCHYHDNRHEVQRILSQSSDGDTSNVDDNQQQQQQEQHGVDTELYRLLHSQQWDDAVQHLTVHPDEARVCSVGIFVPSCCPYTMPVCFSHLSRL
mmetsp:Transcript_1468/g.2331  ORF Transcript_1468/g.2331 Transcript_1468/m.2331 type:complete len:365 (+) Transcript_1468:422-1516(+)